MRPVNIMAMVVVLLPPLFAFPPKALITNLAEPAKCYNFQN
jgi:hypothetical protein